MNTQEKKNKKINVLCYVFYFVSLSYWITSSLNIMLLRVVQMGVIIAIMLVEKKYVIKKNALVISTILLLLELFTAVFKSYHLTLDFAQLSGVIIALIFVSIVGSEMFKGSYVDFMTFISGYSLIMWGAYKIIPQFFYRLPTVKATALTANTIFSLVPIQMNDYYRNFGCFEEPGVYQIFLCLAIMLTLFNHQRKFRKIILFYLTMLTTLSTAGYIVACGILVAYLFSRSSGKIEGKFKRNLLMCCLCVGIISAFVVSNGGNVIDSRVFEKFQNLTNGSAFERFRAVSIALNSFENNILLGCGWGNWSQSYLNKGILTCTPLNWFAIYGFLYGIITNLGIYLACCQIANSRQSGLLLSICFWMMIFSQDMAGNVIILCIILYAYNDIRWFRKTNQTVSPVDSNTLSHSNYA